MRLVPALIAFLLILGTVYSVDAVDCTPDDCIVDEKCIKHHVRIDQSKTYVPGEIVEVDTGVSNRMACYEEIMISFRYRYKDEQIGKRVAVQKKKKWANPNILVTLGKKKDYDFIYDLVLPNDIPAGRYFVFIDVEGLTTGYVSSGKGVFTVTAP